MLSIVIIAKNEENALPILLKSIKKQKTKIKYEVILSDAGSTDNTLKIAKSYGCKIVKGGMPSIGRNRGARVAKYELILFLDADVALPPNCIEEFISGFKNKKLDFATCLYKPMTNDWFIKFMYWFYNTYARLLQHLLPHAGGFCILIKKKLFNKINGFNEEFFLCEDMDLLTRAHKHGRFGIITKTYVKCDVRRITKEGKFMLIVKYVYGGIYRLFLRDSKKPIFSYTLHGDNISVNERYRKIMKKKSRK